MENCIKSEILQTKLNERRESFELEFFRFEPYLQGMRNTLFHRLLSREIRFFMQHM